MNKCLQCGKETKTKFCSQSHAATYNNTKNPKRLPQGKCKTCGKAIQLQDTYCSKDCYKKGWVTNPHNYHGKENRVCSECNLEFPNTTENFYIKNKKTKMLYSYCKQCFSKLQSEYHAKLKHECLAYLNSFECKICGYKQHEHNLTFHHLDPDKKEMKIASTKRNIEGMKKELDKCIVVCHHCHSNIHKGFHPEFLLSGKGFVKDSVPART